MMNILKNSLKTIIKAGSGYQIRRWGKDSASSVALAKDNIEILSCDPDSLLLVNKKENEVIATEGIYNELQTLRLKTILDAYKVNLVLDVGANTGEFAQTLRRTGYKGKIFSFEPISSVYEVLKEKASQDQNWDTYNLALGRQNGEQLIHISDMTHFSSFLNSNSFCAEEFGKVSIGIKDETVAVARLDKVLSEAIENIDKMRIYLKMDTQGYDLEVFAGVGNLLPYIVALQSEVSVVPIYENMPHITDSISIFEKSGFILAGMYPVNTSSSTLEIIEFDCMMIKPGSTI